MRLYVALIVMTLAVSACANKGLRELDRNTRGPDEFVLEPKAALEQPESYAALPPPTPGQANRTDNDPLGDAVAALGGRRTSPLAPIPASDGALVTAASRYGVTPGIRSELAQEDAEFRRRQSRFTQYRLFPEDNYDRAYRREALDPQVTADRWRNAGARTPSYPPRN